MSERKGALPLHRSGKGPQWPATARGGRATLQAAQDVEADVISTPCPLCQTNVETYQDAINKKFGTNFDIPVVFYSELMAVAFGMDPHKDAALQRNMVRSGKP